jgi:hypothetical protein
MTTTSRSYQWKRNGTAIDGASGASYVVQAGDEGKVLTCAVTETNSAGSTTATTAASQTVATPAGGGLPNAPSGPTAPAAGYRVIFGDDFNGSSLDTSQWVPSTGGNTTGLSGPFNSYEEEVYNSDNVTVSNSQCVLTCKAQNMNFQGRDFSYTSGVISTGSASNPFLFSPYHGGTFYIEARIKIPGDAPGSNGSIFPAFWASTYRTYGRSSNDNLWTREMDFFEFGSRTGSNSNQVGQNTTIDTVNISPEGGYGSGTTMSNSGAYYTAIIADMASDFHVYTVQINTDGSFSMYIDGSVQFNMPAATAIDWMGILFNYALNQNPGGDFTSDAMLIDYLIVWQDASVPAGQGVIGGGIVGSG